MRQEIFKIDVESLDLVEQEQLILKAKELLTLIHDRDPQFEYDVYYNGTEYLKKAANFVDWRIHEPEENEYCSMTQEERGEYLVQVLNHDGYYDASGRFHWYSQD